MKIKIHEAGKYELLEDFEYYSERYQDYIVVEAGIYDGATGAMDITTKGWWIHDQVCNHPHFLSGTPITAWQASNIIYDVLAEERRHIRKFTWKFSTFLFGCKLAKKNGWF